jgi:hypothetical protein
MISGTESNLAQLSSVNAGRMMLEKSVCPPLVAFELSQFFPQHVIPSWLSESVMSKQQLTK